VGTFLGASLYQFMQALGFQTKNYLTAILGEDDEEEEKALLEINRIASPEGIFNVDYWRRISAASDDSEEIKNQTKMDIIQNRSSYLYIEEIYNYEKIIDQLSKSIGFNVFYWSGDSDIIYRLPSDKLKQKKYIINDLISNITENPPNIFRLGGIFFDTIKHYGGLIVKEETNGNCTDTHLGESGHRVQFELFYNYIIKNI
jgi:hypothetical protein